MEVTLTLQNSKELMKVFSQAPGIAAKEYRIALEQIAESVRERAVKNAPANKGDVSSGKRGKRGYGGNLRQSIRKYPYGQTGFIVNVGADYGVYVDQGTKPHIIRPKNKQYLTFKSSDGTWIRARQVNHPGTKPTFFFTNAVRDSELEANGLMSKAMDRVLNQLGK